MREGEASGTRVARRNRLGGTRRQKSHCIFHDVMSQKKNVTNEVRVFRGRLRPVDVS